MLLVTLEKVCFAQSDNIQLVDLSTLVHYIYIRAYTHFDAVDKCDVNTGYRVTAVASLILGHPL